MKPRVTADRLREVLNYDSETGVFTWKATMGSRAGGSAAGTVTPKGRRHIAIDRVVFTSHRLAWLYVYGEWPVGQIDHRNLNKQDDSIANLRLATRQGNSANRRALRNNKLGVKGVQQRAEGVFRARIRVNARLINLGQYATAAAASSAYATAALEHFGEFARAS